MIGVALGRLWDTHPKMAFVIHLLLTVYIGLLDVWAFASGNTGGGVVLAIGFAVMAAGLAFLTWYSARNDWQPDYSSDYGRGQVVTPRAAWANTASAARILWLLFGVAFLAAIVLLIAKSILGVVLIVAALALAIIAMRMD